MIAKIHNQAHEFFRARDFFDTLNGAHTNVEGLERGKLNDRFKWSGNEFHHVLPLELGCVVGRGNRLVATGIANGRIGHESQRNDASPNRKAVIFSVVLDVAYAYFGGSFG